MHDIERRAQKMEIVTPELVADLSARGDAVRAAKLVRIDRTLLAYGPDDPLLYRIDLDTKGVETANHGSIRRVTAAATPKEHDTVVFVSEGMNIVEYDKKSGVLIGKSITYPQPGPALADIMVYNQRLYTLDPGANQIYRHAKTQTGYDKGVEWIKDAERDVHDAIAFAIDGDIFLLEKDGEIQKYSAGKKVPFAVSGLAPPLSAPTAIWTYNGVDRLYILEAATKRFIILTTDGKLVRQMTSDAWQGPTGMSIDTDASVAYILDSNKVYRVAL